MRKRAKIANERTNRGVLMRKSAPKPPEPNRFQPFLGVGKEPKIEYRVAQKLHFAVRRSKQPVGAARGKQRSQSNGKSRARGDGTTKDKKGEPYVAQTSVLISELLKGSTQLLLHLGCSFNCGVTY